MAKRSPTRTGAPTIGIDVGGTNITGGLVSASNRILARHRIDTEADQGPQHVIDRIVECVTYLASHSKTPIAAVGLGIPGAVDPRRGLVLEAVNLRWKNLKLDAELKRRIQLPIVLDNDVNVGTWGSYRLGTGKGAENLMGIFIGTGIGGGFVFNGQLFHGHFKTAGEIGHTVLAAHGPVGLRTLEQLASRTAVVNRLTQMVNANHPSSLPKLAGKKWPKIRSKVLAKAMKSNDELTIRVLHDAAHHVGVAIANVVTLLSIDRVVVGGGLTEALDSRWIRWIRESFLQHAFPDVCHRCKIVPSVLGDDAGLIGAALLARDQCE